MFVNGPFSLLKFTQTKESDYKSITLIRFTLKLIRLSYVMYILIIAFSVTWPIRDGTRQTYAVQGPAAGSSPVKNWVRLPPATQSGLVCSEWSVYMTWFSKSPGQRCSTKLPLDHNYHQQSVFLQLIYKTINLHTKEYFFGLWPTGSTARRYTTLWQVPSNIESMSRRLLSHCKKIEILITIHQH